MGVLSDGTLILLQEGSGMCQDWQQKEEFRVGFSVHLKQNL